MNPLILTSAKDKRSGLNKVKSRIEGLEYKAISVYNKDNIYDMVCNIVFDLSNSTKIDVVLVDEANFFTKEHIDQLSDVVDSLGIPVICWGLKTDFRTSFFPSSQRLLEIADEIHEVKSMCSCSKKATINARVENGKVVNKGEQIKIDGDAEYISMCRKCWKKNLEA